MVHKTGILSDAGNRISIFYCRHFKNKNVQLARNLWINSASSVNSSKIVRFYFICIYNRQCSHGKVAKSDPIGHLLPCSDGFQYFHFTATCRNRPDPKPSDYLTNSQIALFFFSTLQKPYSLILLTFLLMCLWWEQVTYTL
jgi:hypothetical protein